MNSSFILSNLNRKDAELLQIYVPKNNLYIPNPIFRWEQVSSCANYFNKVYVKFHVYTPNKLIHYGLFTLHYIFEQLIDNPYYQGKVNTSEFKIFCNRQSESEIENNPFIQLFDYSSVLDIFTWYRKEDILMSILETDLSETNKRVVICKIVKDRSKGLEVLIERKLGTKSRSINIGLVNAEIENFIEYLESYYLLTSY